MALHSCFIGATEAFSRQEDGPFSVLQPVYHQILSCYDLSPCRTRPILQHMKWHGYIVKIALHTWLIDMIEAFKMRRLEIAAQNQPPRTREPLICVMI